MLPLRPLAAGSGMTLFTAADLAKRWKVTEAQVYRLTRDGALPAVKLGRYYRYRVDAIEHFERAGGAGERTLERAA
jgi:excisionase family DNA binding protein